MEKRALVLSGGGSKGAYSVGVVKALLESGRKYDVVAGVSVGALIGSHVAMYKPDEQWASYETLEHIWTKEVRSDRSIYKPWAPGFLTYLWSLWKAGIYSMRPLRDILEKELKPDILRNSGVEFEVGVVSLQTGKYHSKNLTSNIENNKMAVDWVWASCIFPVLFPPVELNNEQWVDGGVRDVIPVKDVIKYGVTHIDAVLTAPQDGFVTPVGMLKTSLDVGLRSIGLLSDEIYTTDMSRTCQNNNVVLEIFDPAEQVNEDSFRFDPEEIRKLIDMGYNDTKAKLSLAK